MLLLAEQNNKCNARDQASDAVLRKLLCVKYVCRHVIDNHSRDLQASNCARVSIKPSRATRYKRQPLKIFKRPTAKARSTATFLLTNLGSRPAAVQRRTVTKWATTYKRTVTTPRRLL